MYCENCRKKFWESISKLPNEVCSIIFSYVRNEEKVFLNKEFYENYHYLISSKISYNNYDNYIRDIIRTDSSYVLNQLKIMRDGWLKENVFIRTLSTITILTIY